MCWVCVFFLRNNHNIFKNTIYGQGDSPIQVRGLKLIYYKCVKSEKSVTNQSKHTGSNYKFIQNIETVFHSHFSLYQAFFIQNNLPSSLGKAQKQSQKETGDQNPFRHFHTCRKTKLILKHKTSIITISLSLKI